MSQTSLFLHYLSVSQEHQHLVSDGKNRPATPLNHRDVSVYIHSPMVEVQDSDRKSFPRYLTQRSVRFWEREEEEELFHEVECGFSEEYWIR